MGGGVMISKDTFYIPGPAGPSAYGPASSAFVATGGHEWSITYYPDSLYDHDSFDLCLRLVSEGVRVTISAVGLVDPTGTLLPLNLVPLSPPFDFDSLNDGGTRRLTHWVPKKFITQTLHQTYGQGCGGLMFEWTITVLPHTMPMQMPEPVLSVPVPVPMPILEQLIPKPKFKIVRDVASTTNNAPATTDVAPSLRNVPATTTADVAPPLAKVLPSTDVTFSVGGELFHAHKAILCMRSPVVREDLSGSPRWATIGVDGMAPDVFEALLHYVYTDTLPGDTEEGESDYDDASQTMTATRSLLVEADRYGMDELKRLGLIVC
nr:unnamed protein product [Digitaria exilis]